MVVFQHYTVTRDGIFIVWAYLPGAVLAEETLVTIGVFRGAPNQPPAVLYACLMSQPTLLEKGAQYQGNEPRIKQAAIDGPTRLCIEANPGLDLNGDDNPLLDAIKGAALDVAQKCSV